MVRGIETPTAQIGSVLLLVHVHVSCLIYPDGQRRFIIASER